MTSEILDKVGPFVFSIGGIGDLLLLTNNCDFPDPQTLSIIFWAHNHILLREALESEPFGVKFIKKLVFQGWQSKEEFDLIVSHKNFRGKGHVPDNMDFIGEWTNHADKYLGQINSRWSHDSSYSSSGPICVCLHGSNTETWKRRRATQEEQNKILKHLLDTTDKKIMLIGSPQDAINFPPLIHERIVDARHLDFKSQFNNVMNASEVLSVDTWPKTLAGLMKKKCTVIRNEYLIPIKQIFESGVDPSDNIFLAPKWNFQFTTFKELCP